MTNYYSMGAHLPELGVEIAFESDPDDATQVWTDVGADVISLSTRRGRSDDLGRAEAGTLSLQLRNPHRRYDPDATGTNLVTNGWAETDTSGWSTGAPSTLVRSSAQQAQGTHSFLQTYQSGGWYSASRTVTVVTATDYVIGCRFYIPASTTSQVELRMTGYDSTADRDIPAKMGLKDEWQWVTGGFRTTTDVVGNIQPRFADSATSGEAFYFDNVFITPAPASPFAGNVDVMKRVRVRAKFGGTEYDVWHGLITGWTQGWLGTGGIAVVNVEAVDLFRVLALRDAEYTEAEEATGTRIGNVLDTAGWPAGDRALDTGTQTLAAQASATRNLLSECQAAAEAERGIFFIAGNGDATFLDGLHKIENSTTSQATFTDLAAEVLGTKNWRFDSSISGWVAEGGSSTAAWDGDVDREGRPGSGSLYSTLVPNGGGPRHPAPSSSAGIVAAQGDVIRAWYWILPDGDDLDMRLRCFEYQNGVYQSTFADSPSTTCPDGVWTKVEMVFTVSDPDTNRLRFDVERTTGTPTTASFWIDDFGCEYERADDAIGYAGIEPGYDDTRLANDVIVSWSGGTETASDSTSQGAYLQRTRNVSTELATAGGAAGHAAAEIYWFAYPSTRYPSITVETVDDNDTQIADILGLEVWDLVTVRRTPPEENTPIVSSEYVEGVGHDIGVYSWTTTFDLSPADDGTTTFLVLDDATDGKLGSGNYWAPA